LRKGKHSETAREQKSAEKEYEEEGKKRPDEPKKTRKKRRETAELPLAQKRPRTSSAFQIEGSTKNENTKRRRTRKKNRSGGEI